MMTLSPVKLQQSEKQVHVCLKVPEPSELISHLVCHSGLLIASSSECLKLLLSSSLQLRRQVRLRREYLYRKAQEDRLRTIEEKKQNLKSALDGERLLLGWRGGLPATHSHGTVGI